MKQFLDFLFPYRRHLETELIILRTDFQERLAEKDRRIAQLEDELSLLRGKCDRMELVLMPLSSTAGAAYARRVKPQPPRESKASEPVMTSWQSELLRHQKQLDQDELKEQSSHV